MPRYFFHLHNGVECSDDQGVDLPGLDAARAFAIESARSVMAQNVREGVACLSDRIQVEDDAGHSVLSVRFGEVVTILP